MSAAPPPPLARLEELAARAVGHLGDADGQAAVLWERRRGSAGEREALTVTVTAVVEGRAATATAAGTDDAQLARAAKAATVNAGRARAWPAAPLPDGEPGRAHDAWDPAVLTWQLDPLDGLSWEAGAARTAIASTRGVRAAEQRTHVRAELRRGTTKRTVVAAGAGVGPGAIAPAALVAEAETLERAGSGPVDPPDGEVAIVLGAAAVGALLDVLRPAFGVDLDVGGSPLAGHFGTKVAAPAVNLSDSARHPRTLQRSFDAEGVPRRPVPLIQDGVAHRRVHDSASAARAGATSTGHAARAGALAAIPEQLVLVGGGAEGIEELAAPVGDGLYVPALGRDEDGGHLTRGAVRIDGGALGGPVADHPVEIDALAVLAGVEALAGRQQLVALPGHTPGGIGAALVPALRTRAGLRSART